MILISLCLISLCLVSLSLIPLSLLLLSLLLLLPIPITSISLMFHHHGRRRWRSLLTPHRTHQHHAANHRSSQYLRSNHRLSCLSSLLRCSFPLRRPLELPNNPISLRTFHAPCASRNRSFSMCRYSHPCTLPTAERQAYTRRVWSQTGLTKL
jgi:hypothetical protein